jgi:uncharacterized repeat protein (TIGR04052 family)
MMFNVGRVYKTSVIFMVTLWAFGCTPSSDESKPTAQTMTFKLAMKSQLLTCSDLKGGVLLQGKRWQIDALKLYVNQLTLIQGGSKEVAELLPSGWQTNDVALLSLESDLCDNTQSEDTNHTLHFKHTTNLDQIDKIGFVVGVPFGENHRNPLTQPSPLNLPLMFWSWQSGHKFIRWDMTQDDVNWSFHLGSLGCESASSVRAPNSPCTEPNTISVEIAKPRQNKHTIWVHLDRMVEGLDLSDDSGCVLHDVTEESCTTLIQNLQYNEVFEWR